MTPLFIIGLLLSTAIGLSLGLIGGGGSILTVPILVYFLGVSPHEAVGMSLAVVGATSLFGTFLHYRVGNVDLKGGLLFGSAGTVGALAGSPLTKLVPAGMLLLIFGVLMLVVASMMLWRKNAESREPLEPQPHLVQAVAAGFGVGLLTGFLGVGGGFLIVPALVFFGGMPVKRAIGTSLFVIFLNCVSGLIGHMSQDSFHAGITVLVIGLALAGTIAGTILSKRFHATSLQRLFAVLVLFVGFALVIKNSAAIF